MNFEEAYRIANNARNRAISGACKYDVGAVLEVASGKKYTGCNISNDEILSICAERTAFVKALSEGENSFTSIVVVGGRKGSKLEKTLPCGYCRQFMRQFVNPKTFKIYAMYDNKVEEYTLEELLPYSYDFKEQ